MLGQKKLFALLAAFASWGGLASMAEACSVCLTGAEDATAEAINASVLFLMATPYLVVGSIVAGIFFSCRSAARKRPTEDTEQAVLSSAWTTKETQR
jgi:hypothetical protein